MNEDYSDRNEESAGMRPDDTLDPALLGVQLVLTVLAAYLHTFSEWLFFVTKPSFMLQSGAAGRLLVLLLSPLPPVLAWTALVLLWHLLSRLARDPAWRRRIAAAGMIVPALILAGTALLLIDNFTYTILRRGVITAGPLSIWIYRLLFPLLALAAAGYLGKKGSFPARNTTYRRLDVLARGLLVISLVAALLRPDAFSAGSPEGGSGGGEGAATPNILLLVSDGLNADHMSLYGYSRDTTPFLRSLLPKGLLCENCFTNAGSSGASIASMLTGRLPTSLRLICPPDILRGTDAYRHLPGILKRLGYRTFDISVRDHADPYDLNMRRGFDWANHREIREGALSETLGRYLGQEPDYFLQKMHGRMSGRLLHIYGIRRMVDSYGEVVVESRKHRRQIKRTGRTGDDISKRSEQDFRRIDSFFSFIDQSPRPFFAHLHLLGTHGPRFYPSRKVFSRRKKQPGEWMTDFYDDAILSFDQIAREVVRGLQKRGLRENTLIVVLTDHGRQWSIDNRIPMMFLFPGGEHSGRIRGNAQILDISPTILDYMGIAPPEWMEGSSLLAGEPGSGRPVFTIRRRSGKTGKGSSEGNVTLDPRNAGPPFYTLGSLGVFQRQNLYKLVLAESRLEISTVAGHTFPAAPAELPATAEIERLLVEHLAERGYDVSSLKRPLTVERIEPKSEEEASPAERPKKRRPPKNRETRKHDLKRLR